MTDKIERLAEINVAGEMFKLGPELINERQIIVNYLKVMNTIELDPNGGFHFVGENASANREIYLDSYNNF